MNATTTPNITVMYCINSFAETAAFQAAFHGQAEISFVKMACSSMVKDVFILRAFEAGADAVAVFVCPEGSCRYTQGNIRAAKRIGWVRGLLDEIGLDGRRLSLSHMTAGDGAGAERCIGEALKTIEAVGLSPAR